MSRYTRFHGNRQSQLENLRKEGWQVVTYKTAPVVVAFQEKAGRIWVKLWKNKADKPAFFHTFRSLKSAEEFVSHSVTQIAGVEAWRTGRKAELKAKRDALKASDHWSVGDVLYNSWGYEQTNIDWYQVVEVKAKSIVIRAVAKNFGATGWLQGRSQPRRNDFCGDPMLKPLDENGHVSMRHGAATKWDGRAVHESSYH